MGLGNPGPDYEATRHNVGAWFVESLAKENALTLQADKKFQGRIARLQSKDQDCWLLIPTTFMNCCGLSVKMMAQFYKILPENILIAHDELDFSAGIVRLKMDGGHGGHNGLRDIIAHLSTRNFHRLRIGIGHPGHRDQVTDYVLSRPSRKDYDLIINAIDNAKMIMPEFLKGEFQKATQQLHMTE